MAFQCTSLYQPTPEEQTTEGQPIIPQDESQSYAKDQLGVRQGEMKLLGVPWNKEEDAIQITFRARLPMQQREKS